MAETGSAAKTSKREKRLFSGMADLISLDSPRKNGCPTGVLIDLSDAVQLTYPKELQRIGEFDDTFGIYTYPASTAAPSSSAISRRSSTSNCRQSEVAKLFCIDESMDMGSERTDRLQTPGTPPPTRRSFGRQLTPNGLLSDTDSLLDLDNLSAFSFSDSEDLLEELRNKNTVDDNWGPSPLTIAKEIEEMVRIERSVTATVTVPPEEEPQPIQKRENRMSLQAKVQRLSLLLNSPVPSPPSPACKVQPSKNIQSIPISSMDLPSSTTAKPASRMSISTSTMTSPMPKDCEKIEEGSKSQVAGSQTPSSKISKIQYFSYTPTSSHNKSPIKRCAPREPVSPSGSVDSTHSSSSNTTSAFKRLSFSSMSSASTSPTKSLKNEPMMFGIRRATVGGGGPGVGAFQSRSSFKSTLAAKGRSSIKPLKATVAIPQATITGYSGNGSIANPDTTIRNNTTIGTIDRLGCVSAPVTRKFIPPIAASSPNPNGNGNTPGFVTPTRTVRKSFTNIRSSGYGQPSPSSKITAPSPISNYFPSPIVRGLPSPKPNTRQVMGIKGQVPVPLNESKIIPPTMPIQKVEPSGTGIRRSSSVSKENKPKLNSFLPRAGYGFTRPAQQH